MAALMKKAPGEGDDRIDRVELDGLVDGFSIFLQFATLHERGVKVQIVRHHRGANDRDGAIKHAGLGKRGMEQGAAEFEEIGGGLREDKDFEEIAEGDGGDENADGGLKGAHAEALQGQEQENVAAGDDDGPEDRNVEKEVERDGAAKDFGEIAGADGQFAQEPVGPACPGGIPLAAALGEIAAGDDAEPRGENLHEDGHEAGDADDPEEAVFVLRARGEVCAPVAWVHVTDGNEERGADEGAVLPPEPGRHGRDGDGGVEAFERRMGERNGRGQRGEIDRRGDGIARSRLGNRPGPIKRIGNVGVVLCHRRPDFE